MFHRPIAPPADIHSAWCGCRSCLERDPLRFARRRRAMRAWALLFVALLAVLYGTLIANLPAVADAFAQGGGL
ncbi:MAG TPA: hypothetical protein VNH53_03910 [Sphingomicrobium sp.]|nr:hypothetical protein [Sphingomicrobium sp.]